MSCSEVILYLNFRTLVKLKLLLLKKYNKPSILKPVYFIILFLILGCNEETLENKISEVKKLQHIAKHNVNDSTLLYLEQAQKIIENTPKVPDTLVIENIFRKGYYHYEINQLDSASFYFHKTINLIEKPNERGRNLVYFWNAWYTEERRSQYANAISIAEKFIDITDEDSRPNDVLYAYNCLERLYLDLRDYEKTLYYNGKTLEASRKSSDWDMFVITGASKANKLYNYLDKKEKAFKLLDSLKMIKAGRDARRQLFRTYGVLNYKEGNYQAAISNFKQVLYSTKNLYKFPDHNNKYKNNEQLYSYDLLEGHINIAEVYIDMKAYEKAEKHLDSSKMNINATSFSDNVLLYNELRFRLNYRTSNDEGELLKEYFALIDQNKKEHQKNIDEELTALKLAIEKEAKITAKKNEVELKNFRLIALLGLLLFLLILGYLIYRQRRYRFERQSLQMQQRLLRSQMSPHFTFNAISAIGNQLEKQPKEGLLHLSKFAHHMRLVLENSTNDFVLLDKELEVLKKYLDLQLLRYPDLFKYTISLQGINKENSLYIPPMLIQPIVENSIEHGFSNSIDSGVIDIRISKKDNRFLYCEIEDNGKGIKTVKRSNKRSTSMFLISNFLKKATGSSLVILNKNELDNTKTGVQISFLIPFKNTERD